MNEPNLLEMANKELQDTVEEQKETINELNQRVAVLPTEEDYNSLQKENTELKTELASVDTQEMKDWAEIGKHALSIAQEDAKDAFKAKLMSDGVDKSKVEEHPEYVSIVKDIDDETNIRQLSKWAQSYFRMARSNRSAGRISEELNGYGGDPEKDSTFFVKGVNDIR